MKGTIRSKVIDNTLYLDAGDVVNALTFVSLSFVSLEKLRELITKKMYEELPAKGGDTHDPS